MDAENFIKWDAQLILNIEQSETKYALALLNRPILFAPEYFQQLWNNATIRVLVDGGANEWFKFAAKHELEEHLKAPDFSIGDMDSITEESIQRLNDMKCQRIYAPDQEETDCTKSIISIRPYLREQKIRDVLLLTDFGGRIDQLLSQINTLFKQSNKENVNIYLRSRDTLAWLLWPGQHEIQVSPEYVAKQVWCAYIPMNGRCNVSTTGLKYDLNDGFVEFGVIISSSNTYKSSTVRIICDNHLFWSMGINLCNN